MRPDLTRSPGARQQLPVDREQLARLRAYNALWREQQMIEAMGVHYVPPPGSGLQQFPVPGARNQSGPLQSQMFPIPPRYAPTMQSPVPGSISQWTGPLPAPPGPPVTLGPAPHNP